MNASKENARKALKALRGWATEDLAVDNLKQTVKEFLEAAERQLPSEKVFAAGKKAKATN